MRWRSVLLGVVGLSLVVGAIAYTTAPEGISLATLVLALTCLAALAHPPLGIYLIIFFTLIGDIRTTNWWPFTKNFSSPESVFFVDDRLSINPLEVVLGVTIAAWVMRAAADRTWRFYRGRLLYALVAF